MKDHSVWLLITGSLNSKLIQKIHMCVEPALWLYNFDRIYIWLTRREKTLGPFTWELPFRFQKPELSYRGVGQSISPPFTLLQQDYRFFVFSCLHRSSFFSGYLFKRYVLLSEWNYKKTKQIRNLSGLFQCLPSLIF